MRGGKRVWLLPVYPEVGTCYESLMRLQVNGEVQEFEDRTMSAEALLDRLGLADRRVAVEVNRRIVPRTTYPEHSLEDGDVVEIVHFVGGG